MSAILTAALAIAAVIAFAVVLCDKSLSADKIPVLVVMPIGWVICGSLLWKYIAEEGFRAIVSIEGRGVRKIYPSRKELFKNWDDLVAIQGWPPTFIFSDGIKIGQVLALPHALDKKQFVEFIDAHGIQCLKELR